MATVLPDNLSIPGLNTIRSQEGRALRAYQDAVGVWTVGYGLTNYDKHLPWRVQHGLVITEGEAEWYLYKSVRENYLPDVRRALDGGEYDHPQGVVDGGCDFHFNCGGIRKASWPRELGRRQMAAAEASMKSWNKAGGRVLADLVRRRAADWVMVSTGQYGHVSGPLNVVPNAAGRESYHGYGDLLSAYPTDPALTGAAPSAPGPVTTPPAAPTTQAPGVYRAGMEGPGVTDEQIKLNKLGAGIPVTGVYDAATVTAVTRFQQSHPNLTADGEIGPATDAALDREINLRTSAGKLSKVATPTVPGMFVALHQWASTHVTEIAIGAAIVVVLGVAGYIAYQHRYDIASWFNRARGKAVA